MNGGLVSAVLHTYPPPASAHLSGTRMEHRRADAVQSSKIYRAGEEERQDRRGRSRLRAGVSGPTKFIVCIGPYMCGARRLQAATLKEGRNVIGGSQMYKSKRGRLVSSKRK